MTDERAVFDGDGEHLDEIVATNVTVHIERMDTHHWMIRFWRAEKVGSPSSFFGEPVLHPAVDFHLGGSDLYVVEGSGLPETIRPPLLICTEWTDRQGGRHECRVNKVHKEHRCGCGKRRPVDA